MVNPRLQPTEIGLGTTSGNSTALRLGYGYGTTSNNGNIQSQDIVINTSTTISPSYTYNQVNRLLTATEGATWSQNYSYDQDGNRAVTGYIINSTLTPGPGAFNAATTGSSRAATIHREIKFKTQAGESSLMTLRTIRRTSTTGSGLTAMTATGVELRRPTARAPRCLSMT